MYRDEPVYEQVWVPNPVEVFDHRQERYVCRCGAVFYGKGELDSHMYANNKAGLDTCFTYLDDSYDVYKTVDKGSYQERQAGTKKVLDHYECACGAAK